MDRSLIALSAVAIAAGTAVAVPTNTTLPMGFSWQPAPGGVYDTGLAGTPRGGFNTQANPPFQDTSFGVMNEPGTPWFTGGDLSAQQYVQRQVFGNFGTAVPPAPAGFRYYNFGYGGTMDGRNFPRTANEARGISLNHWNNPFPDAGGVATLGQVVYVPVAATLTAGLGWGGDEMLLRIIGGVSGQRSQFFVDATLEAAMSTTAFGGLALNNNRIRVNAVVQANDGGPGSYDVAWGYGATNAPQVTVNRVDNLDGVFVNNAFVQNPGQGIPANSVGHGFSRDFDVLANLVQTGGSFNLGFTSSADINNLVRDFGDADARAQIGPGFEGTARLVVRWEAFVAIPTPGSAALLALGGLVASRRKR